MRLAVRTSTAEAAFGFQRRRRRATGSPTGGSSVTARAFRRGCILCLKGVRDSLFKSVIAPKKFFANEEARRSEDPASLSLLGLQPQSNFVLWKLRLTDDMVWISTELFYAVTKI